MPASRHRHHWRPAIGGVEKGYVCSRPWCRAQACACDTCDAPMTRRRVMDKMDSVGVWEAWKCTKGHLVCEPFEG